MGDVLSADESSIDIVKDVGPDFTNIFMWGSG